MKTGQIGNVLMYKTTLWLNAQQLNNFSQDFPKKLHQTL